MTSTYLGPNPNPIPPELPSDPTRAPPPDIPINTPPEKGPGAPEPIPPSPIPPTRVVRPHAIVAITLAIGLASAPALAQRTIGKDTSELTPANPLQQCTRFTNADERARCIEQHQGSGSALGNPRGGERQPANPSVGHEERHAEPRQGERVDPNLPAPTAR